MTKENQIVPVNVVDSSPEKKEETNSREYIPKTPFPQGLAKGKKEKSTCEILEIFKHVSVNILYLILQNKFHFMPSFLKTFVLKMKIFMFKRMYF